MTRAGAAQTEVDASIERAEVIQVEMTMIEPFVTSFGPTTTRHVLLVRLTDADGAVGWGEAAPLDHPFYLPDTVASAFSIIVDHALPLCLRTTVSTGREAAVAMRPIRGRRRRSRVECIQCISP